MFLDERRSQKVPCDDVWDSYQMTSYQVREKMVADKSRPRFHFVPPQGRWNDINGAVFHNGRYHLGYLQKISNGKGALDFSSWQHISSKDLLHWRYQTSYLDEPLGGFRGDYFNSGGIISGAPVPTLIVNMPRKGICIYQCHDDSLDKWEPLPQNPVIPTTAGWPSSHELTESRRRIGLVATNPSRAAVSVNDSLKAASATPSAPKMLPLNPWAARASMMAAPSVA